MLLIETWVAKEKQGDAYCRKINIRQTFCPFVRSCSVRDSTNIPTVNPTFIELSIDLRKDSDLFSEIINVFISEYIFFLR